MYFSPLRPMHRPVKTGIAFPAATSSPGQSVSSRKSPAVDVESGLEVPTPFPAGSVRALPPHATTVSATTTANNGADSLTSLSYTFTRSELKLLLRLPKLLVLELAFM
jgi:hypothetical protein